MEEALVSAENDTPTLIISFSVLAGVVLLSYFVFAYFYPAGWRTPLLTAAVAAVCFIIFGFCVEVSQRKARDKAYRGDITARIERYLGEMNYTRYEFDLAADKTLPEKARLRAYLFKR